VYQVMFKGAQDEDDADEDGKPRHTGACGLWYIPDQVNVQGLRDGLKVLYDGLKAMGNSEELSDCETLMYILHYHALAQTCKLNGLNEFSAKLLTSVCRYLGVMPADKAFFDAGIALREVEATGSAFVILSRFLDIVDNMDDPDMKSSDMDEADFKISDFPQVFPMPKELAIPKPAEEDARQWVLTASLDKELVKEFAKVTCPRCNGQMAEHCLTCPGCQYKYQACVVTGYPILEPTDKVECRTCHAAANNDDWNRYVTKTKTCPWCSNQQAPFF